MMQLNRLCFLLPADADEILDSPPPRCRSSKRRKWHGLCGCCFSRRRDHEDSFEDAPGVAQGPDKHARGGGPPRIFTYAELYIATRGFSAHEILGAGGFGRVYRALLPSDGTLAAVKVVGDRGERFQKSFAAELVAVAQLRHRNLVRLRGWCVHDHRLLLVYDYMPNRSLDRALFIQSSSPPLGWDRRRRIASGLAAALSYLHDQLDTQIIHRDVKASNVMLDAGFNARLGDFGLARWLEHAHMSVSVKQQPASDSTNNNFQFRLTDTSRIGGTIGYLPPESFQQKRGGGVATAKSDVFSFGVVVLEIATGRRAVDLTYPDDQIFMLDWVRTLSDEGRLMNASDGRLPDGSFPISEMERLIHLGLLCSLHDAESRPNMKWIMEALSGDTQLPSLPSFRAHPLYISMSSSSTTTTATSTTDSSSKYLTAAGTTAFLTADNTRSPSSHSPLPNVDTAKEIPYKEIVAITNNFSESQKVAELDFGTGYYGYLDNRIHVLVKRLGMKTCPALRTRFADELKNLGRLRHRHLVQLRGWCTEQGEMLVIYDYSSRSLLSHRLFHRTCSALEWSYRYHIVKSLASAVHYLHEEWEEKVIHRNITSSAVFLDQDMNPRLGSFALAEFLSRNEHGHHTSLSSSSPRGIFGYMSPEYMETGEATTMADVYSFGVVVLELVSGEMAVDFRWPEVLLLRRVWGFEARKRPLEELADRRLEGRFDREEMMRLVRLGIACTSSDTKARPSMKQVVSILDGNEGVLRMLLGLQKQGKEDWGERNGSALSMIRRIQALGIN